MSRRTELIAKYKVEGLSAEEKAELLKLQMVDCKKETSATKMNRVIINLAPKH